jgi:hypothetical protein
MSAPHLRALEEALGRRGWRVAAVHAGDGYRVAATWEVRRGGSRLLIDFDGLSPDGDTCLPLAEGYGCRVRGRPSSSLYFRRVRRSRVIWERELAEFVRSLDEGTPVELGDPPARR